jgi:predicted AlkP superfamily pyrophosphatase or phosphodiesterase
MIFRVPQHGYIYSLLILSLLSCVSKNRVAKEYVENLKRDDQTYTEAKETFVFFLFDGLSVQLTQKLISENQIPNIKSFFLPNVSQFFVGRATFPSLTHPNISSIITSSNIDKHPILGNKIKLGDDLVDFTLPKNQKKLNELIKNQSIFSFGHCSRNKKSPVLNVVFFCE